MGAQHPGNKSLNITVIEDTQVFTGSGTLASILVGKAASGGSGTMAFYDGTDNTGELKGTFELTNQNTPAGVTLDIFFTEGLFIEFSGVSGLEALVAYRQ